jgi:hypothetical protein
MSADFSANKQGKTQQAISQYEPSAYECAVKLLEFASRGTIGAEERSLVQSSISHGYYADYMDLNAREVVLASTSESRRLIQESGLTPFDVEYIDEQGELVGPVAVFFPADFASHALLSSSEVPEWALPTLAAELHRCIIEEVIEEANADVLAELHFRVSRLSIASVLRTRNKMTSI